MDWVSTLSQTLPRVERVILNIHFHDLFDLDAVDWSRIDRYFTQEGWANLHMFRFVLWPRESMIKVERVKAKLPLLGGRGVLDVVRFMNSYPSHDDWEREEYYCILADT
jgi:hypothetical protein